MITQTSHSPAIALSSPAPASAPAAPAQRNPLRRALGAITRPLRQKAWDYSVRLRYGTPETLLVYGYGFGDHLLCTALFRELRKRDRKGLWMMSGHPELFEGNADIDAIVPMSWRYPDLAQRVGGRSFMPNYAEIDAKEDRSAPPDRHIIAKMCQQIGLTGRVELRPYLRLTTQEKAKGRFAGRQIAVQSSILSASMPIRNKEWFPDRFAEVVRGFRQDFTFIQVGSKNDPPLPGVIDMRGRTSVRQTAAIMSQSEVFVGLVGFLMHLARAVDCRAAIVFGGREAPWQSGYSCNENLFTELPCSPCWLWSKCDYGRKCMDEIQADAVIKAVERQIARGGEKLPVDIAMLDEDPSDAGLHLEASAPRPRAAALPVLK